MPHLHLRSVSALRRASENARSFWCYFYLQGSRSRMRLTATSSHSFCRGAALTHAVERTARRLQSFSVIAAAIYNKGCAWFASPTATTVLCFFLVLCLNITQQDEATEWRRRLLFRLDNAGCDKFLWILFSAVPSLPRWPSRMCKAAAQRRARLLTKEHARDGVEAGRSQQQDPLGQLRCL